MVSYGLGSAQRTRRAAPDFRTPRGGGGPRCRCLRESDSTCRDFCLPQQQQQQSGCVSLQLSPTALKSTKNPCENPNTGHNYFSSSVVFGRVCGVFASHVRTSWPLLASRSRSNRLFPSPPAAPGPRHTRFSAPRTSRQPTRAGLRGETSPSNRGQTPLFICELDERCNYQHKASTAALLSG